METINRIPITYPEAIKLLSEANIGQPKYLREAVFESARKWRIFNVKETYYRITGRISVDTRRLEAFEGEQLGLSGLEMTSRIYKYPH